MRLIEGNRCVRLSDGVKIPRDWAELGKSEEYDDVWYGEARKNPYLPEAYLESVERWFATRNPQRVESSVHQRE